MQGAFGVEVDGEDWEVGGDGARGGGDEGDVVEEEGVDGAVWFHFVPDALDVGEFGGGGHGGCE